MSTETTSKMTAEEFWEIFQDAYHDGENIFELKQRMIAYTSSLTAEVERLREALAPFAKFAERIKNDFTSKDYPDTVPMAILPMCMNPAFTLGDCRNAKAALDGKGGE